MNPAAPCSQQRLFLAAVPEAETRVGLAGLRDAVLAAYPADAGLRPVHADDLHLTLRFLGTTPPERLAAIEQAAAELAARHAPTATALHRVERWPAAAPRVIVAAFAHDEALAALAEGLEQAMRALGFAPEQRPFRAHITLARAPGRVLPPAPVAVPLLGFAVRAITLYRSVPNSQPRYAVLAEWPLAKPSG